MCAGLWLYRTLPVLDAGYLLYDYLGSSGWIKKSRKTKVTKKVEAPNPDAANEWLKGTFYGSTKPSRKGLKEFKKAADTRTS